MNTCRDHLWKPSTDEAKGTAECMECGTFSNEFIVVPRKAPIPCKTCGRPDGFICWHGPLTVAVFPEKCPVCAATLKNLGVVVNGSGALPQTSCDNDHWITGSWKTEKSSEQEKLAWRQEIQGTPVTRLDALVSKACQTLRLTQEREINDVRCIAQEILETYARDRDHDLLSVVVRWYRDWKYGRIPKEKQNDRPTALPNRVPQLRPDPDAPGGDRPPEGPGEVPSQ